MTVALVLGVIVDIVIDQSGPSLPHSANSQWLKWPTSGGMPASKRCHDRPTNSR
jgi:hypothetical protein